jgi:acyl carrier protein
MDLVELFNEVISLATPINTRKAYIKDLNEQLSETGLDSLDLLMVGIYLSEIYGVPEEIAKTMQVKTPGEMFEFLQKHATKEVTDIQTAIGSIK